MAAVTICSDFGAQENKELRCSFMFIEMFLLKMRCDFKNLQNLTKI